MDLFSDKKDFKTLTNGVLHVVAGMDPAMGGVSQAVRTMIAGLSTLGIYNEVVSLDAITFEGDRFVHTATGPASTPWNYSARLIPWLTENIGRFNVVIVHGLWLFNGFATLTSFKKLRKKHRIGKDENSFCTRLYVMPHGMLDPYFQKAGGRKLKALRNIYYWKFLEAALINSADGILFTCEEEKLLARQPFSPYHPRQELVVGLGVEEPPVFSPAMKVAFELAVPAIAGRPYLLFLSRIHEKKGVDLLLTAYRAIAKQFAGNISKSLVTVEQVGHTPVDQKMASLPLLVIAGPGLDTPYGRSMQSLVNSDSDLQKLVSFSGMLSGDAKWGAFFLSDALILPSHQENFGIAVVEALACVKPVLISSKVNIWREIEKMGGGFVGDDTATGTEDLIFKWMLLQSSTKEIMNLSARKAYENYFATAPAIRRLLHAIKLLPVPPGENKNFISTNSF